MPRDLISRDKPLVLRPVRPNAGLHVKFRSKLDILLAEMQRSLVYWLSAAYRANEPAIVAQDATPAVALRTAMSRLTRYWTKRWNDAAPDLADFFAKDVEDRSSRTLKSILKKSGFSVEFKATSLIRDTLQATIGENVSLIKSIGAQHLSQVEGLVMRSVLQGRDLATLTDELERRYKISRHRAALISRDQNNKVTAQIQRVRQLDLGITQARWIHSAGGKAPRPTHVKASKDRVVYDIAEGWWDPAEGAFIWPGTLINCCCVAAPVIPGLSTRSGG